MACGSYGTEWPGRTGREAAVLWTSRAYYQRIAERYQLLADGELAWTTTFRSKAALSNAKQVGKAAELIAQMSFRREAATLLAGFEVGEAARTRRLGVTRASTHWGPDICCATSEGRRGRSHSKIAASHARDRRPTLHGFSAARGLPPGRE